MYTTPALRCLGGGVWLDAVSVSLPYVSPGAAIGNQALQSAITRLLIDIESDVHTPRNLKFSWWPSATALVRRPPILLWIMT